MKNAYHLYMESPFLAAHTRRSLVFPFEFILMAKGVANNQPIVSIGNKSCVAGTLHKVNVTAQCKCIAFGLTQDICFVTTYFLVSTI